jgi:hypothetical protein
MRNRIILIAAALFCSLAITATAQQANAWHDSTVRLQARARLLEDSLMTGDSAATEVARRGDLVIAASPRQQSIAVPALDSFAATRQRWFGSAMPSPSGFRIAVQVDGGGRRWDGGTPLGNAAVGVAAQPIGSIILAGLPDSANAVRRLRSSSAADVAATLIDQYASLMLASDTVLTTWLENPPAFSVMMKDRRHRAMYLFVTGTGAMERDCANGDVASCSYALDLEHAPAARTGSIYSPDLRTDLLYYALDLGGAGAWTRLRNATGPAMPAKLAAAAQMPIDSLLARWRTSLLVLRPAKAVLGGESALVALAWSVVLLLTALGASRWA